MKKLTWSLAWMVVGVLVACELPINLSSGTTSKSSASSTNDLASLTPSSGSLSPAFAAATTSYSLEVPNSVTSVTITGSPSDSTATVSAPATVASLTVGTPVVATMTVTAQNGATKAYTVTVRRLAAPSSNADLSSLSCEGGTLSPPFSPSVTSYTVATYESIVRVTGIASEALATVGPRLEFLSLAEETPHGKVITVTAPDGTTKAYSVLVTRAAPSRDIYLSSLSVDAGTLSARDPSRPYNYNLLLSSGAASARITAVPLDSYATVSYSPAQSVSLAAGSTTSIDVVVTTADKKEVRHTISVARAAASVPVLVGQWRQLYRPSSVLPGSPTSYYVYLRFWSDGTWYRWDEGQSAPADGLTTSVDRTKTWSLSGTNTLNLAGFSIYGNGVLTYSLASETEMTLSGSGATASSDAPYAKFRGTFSKY